MEGRKSIRFEILPVAGDIPGNSRVGYRIFKGVKENTAGCNGVTRLPESGTLIVSSSFWPKDSACVPRGI